MDESEFDLGSVFWAKVGSHPWWPCMVYNPPDGSSYLRTKGRSACYHVQFFGPLVERAWVHTSNLIPFEGKRKFDEYVQEKLKQSKDKTEKAKFDSKATTCPRDMWVKSWKEAETALILTPEKRIEKFGRISVKTNIKRISKSEEGEMLKLMSNIPLSLEEEAESLSNFLREETEIRLENNPDVDRKVLEDELRTQWPAFDIATKRRYVQNKLGMFQEPTIPKEKVLRKSLRLGSEQSPKITEKKLSDVDLASGKQIKKKCTAQPPAKQSSDEQELDIEIHRLIVSPAQYRLQPVCPKCEVYSCAPGQMAKCHGPCGRVVHPSCMRYKNPPPPDNARPDKFRCPQCLSGEFLCEICGKPAENTKGSPLGPLFCCSVTLCHRRFHRDCLLDWPGIVTRPSSSDPVSSRLSTFQLVRCPAHSCNTCHLEKDAGTESSSTPLLRCVRCPAAFHTGDLCTPAGSVEVSLSHIVCPRHFDHALNNAVQFKTQHPNWCFKCRRGIGSDPRVNCRTCPTTYHHVCLEPSLGVLSGDTFVCGFCRRGVFPRYAQIVWAKITQIRWWPCEVIHARNAPMNILNMAHPEGSFPIHFLGSGEYQWVSRRSVFPYETGLNTTAAKDCGGSKSLDKAFTRSLARAPRAHQLYVNHVLKRGLPLLSMTADPLPDEELLPASSLDHDRISLSADERPMSEDHKATALAGFTLISSNFYTDKLKSTVGSTNYAVQPCSCHTDSSHRCDSTCQNVQSKVECNEHTCSSTEEKCDNRKFTLLTSSLTADPDQVTIIRTVNRGFGLKTTITRQAGSLILEYVGEVIEAEEANQRIVDALGPSALAAIGSSRKGFLPVRDTFMARLFNPVFGNLVLDGGDKGNLARFINHSCEPNLIVETWVVDKLPRLGLFAKHDLVENEELTINYVDSQFLSTGLMGASCLCLCGTDSCMSTLRLPTSYEIPISKPVSSETAVEHLPVTKTLLKETSSTSEPTTTAHSKTVSKTEAVVKKDKAPVSVVSLLAAATGQVSTRRDRALIQPSSVAARAPALVKGQSYSSGPATTSEDQKPDVTLGLRPPPHEDFCYRCGDGGELVLCDKVTCSKSFHLNCLGLTRPPSGIWFCPWHYCDRCGHPSTHMCWRCPNSFCDEHATLSVIRVDDLDQDRWKAVQSDITPVTSSMMASSFRWICVDHDGLNICGPSHRPRLPDADQPGDPLIVESGGDSRSARRSSMSKSKSNDQAISKNGKKGDPDLATEETSVNKSPSDAPVENPSITFVSESRRVEPLKVTLKRKLKTDSTLLETHNGVNAITSIESTKTVISNESGRKRSVGSNPSSEKKRSRLSQD